MGGVPGRLSIDEMLAAARATLPHRIAADELDDVMARGALVVDTRPVEQRESEGELRGAIIIDRNVLEWRLDPASPHHIDEASSYDIEVVVVCSEGFSSSLVAATLQHLGLHRATDLDGGFRAYKAHRAAQGLSEASRRTS
jgi:rhodanese-related sulfurtransferase